MTKNDILNAINDVNKNKGIKWAVLENKADRIVLTNNYADEVRFSITYNPLLEFVGIRDEFTNNGDGYLIGNNWFADFESFEKALVPSIHKAVRLFYYYY